MRKTAWVLALFLGGLGLAACPGEDAVEGVLVETSEMKFAPTSLRATSGPTTFVVRNTGELRHTFTIENQNSDEVTVAVDETRTLTVDLAPGTYTYVCRILDHEGLGMVGQLRVE